MALPALEGDVVLRDEASPVFVQIANNSGKVNDSLIKVSANADKAAVAVKKMADAGKGGLGDLTKNNDDLKETGTILDDAAEKARRVAENMEALGDASISPQLATNIRKTRDEIDKLDSKVKEFQNAPKGDEKDTKSIADDLEKLGRIGALRQLPGIGQLADIGEVAADFPKLSAGAMAAAGAVGAIGLAAVGAYKGIEAIIGRANELNVANNIKDRLVPKFGDVDAAINEVEAKLQGRLSDQEALTFVAQIDVSGPLAEISTFGNVARTVQAYSDAFGQDWRKNLTDVTKAIQDGNGKFLEQSGVIQSADKAMLDYAASIGKSVPQLDDLERKQALVSAVINDNKDVSNKAPSGPEKFIAAQDKLVTALDASKKSLTDWFATLFDPTAASSLDAYTKKLELLVSVIHTVGNALDEAARTNKLTGGLGGDEVKKFDELRREKSHLEENIFGEKNFTVPFLKIFGSDKDVADAKKRIDDWQVQADRIQAAMDKAQSDFDNKKPVTIPTVAEALKGAGVTPATPTTAPATSAPVQSQGDQQLKQSVDIQKEFLAAKSALTGQYTQSISAAQADLAKSNAELATSEKSLAEAQRNSQQSSNLQGQLDNNQKQLQNVQNQLDAIDLRPKAESLAQVQGLLEGNSQNVQGTINNLTSLIAGLADTSVVQAKIEDSQATLADAVKNGYADLGAIPASPQITGNIDQAIGVMEQAFARGFSSVREMVTADLSKLGQEQADAFISTQGSLNNLAAQGVQVSGSNAEDQALAAQEMLAKAKDQLSDYQARLAQVKEEQAQVQARIQQLSSAPAGLPQASGAELDQLKEDLKQKEADLLKQEASLREAIGKVAVVPAGQTEALQDSAKMAAAEQKANEARLKLIEAERQLISSGQGLKIATEGGDAALAQQFLSEEKLAEENYKLALSQAKAAGASTELSDAAQKLPSAFDDVLNATSTLAQGGIGAFEEWKIQATQIVNDAKSDIENKSIKPPAITGSSDKKDDGSGVANLSAANDLSGSFLKLTPAINSAAQAYAGYFNVVAAGTDTTNRQMSAVNDLSGAFLGLGNVASRAASQQAAAANDLSGSFINLTASMKAQASAAYESAAAFFANNAAIGQQSKNLGSIVQENGKLYDAVSGLPVAFNAATLSSGQLDTALKNLELAMQGIENSSIQAGFAVANRLTPALGSAGALRVGRQFAAESATLKRAIEEENAALAQQGRAPLGLEAVQGLYSELTTRQNTLVENTATAAERSKQAYEAQAQAATAAAEQINSALDGMISGVLQDSTKGLIPDLDKLLPREDAVDEPARRMADVAVKGFLSPWFEGLKNLFPPDILAQGEGAIKTFAAQMVRNHQEGLTTALYDVDAAAARVIEKIKAQQNQSELVAQVREKVKGLAGASDLDIMDALGINTAPVRLEQFADKAVQSFESIAGSVHALAEGVDSPFAALTNPKPEDLKGLTDAGANAASYINAGMVSGAADAKFGTAITTALTGQIDAKKESLQNKGKEMAKWMGDKLVEQFKTDVPAALLEILVTKLIPLMTAAGKAESERTSGGETQ